MQQIQPLNYIYKLQIFFFLSILHKLLLYGVALGIFQLNFLKQVSFTDFIPRSSLLQIFQTTFIFKSSFNSALVFALSHRNSSIKMLQKWLLDSLFCPSFYPSMTFKFHQKTQHISFLFSLEGCSQVVIYKSWKGYQV